MQQSLSPPLSGYGRLTLVEVATVLARPHNEPATALMAVKATAPQPITGATCYQVVLGGGRYHELECATLVELERLAG